MRMPILAALAVAVFAASPAVAQKDNFEFLKKETIGELRMGTTQAEVARLLPGQPQRNRERLEEADGKYRQKWTYARQGIVLSMSSDKKGAPKIVDGITCDARCTLKTSRGIGIGSSLADVQKAYAVEFNKEESKLPGSYVAGSIYGGLILNFKGGKVSAFFLGAAAWSRNVAIVRSK